MFLSLLLFLILLIFPFLYFCVWLPSSFSVENYVAFCVHAVWYFWQAVVSTSGTEFNFIFGDINLFKTEVTLPDEPSDRGDHTTVKCNQLDSHVSSYILDGKISTDQWDGKFDLFLFFEHLFVLERLKEMGLFFCLEVCSVDFGHFLCIISWCNPAFLIIHIAIFLMFLFFLVGGDSDPAFFVIKGLLGLWLFWACVLWFLFIDGFWLFFNDFLYDRERLFS